MNDMKEQFVTYEIALALKELGFDEPCLSYWFTVNGNNPQISKNDIYFNGYKNYHDSNTIAPLWQQAFRWFRDKHNLDSWIYCPNESKGYFAIILKDKRFVSYNEQFDTYEEAELACLNKLIEIVKENENNK